MSTDPPIVLFLSPPDLGPNDREMLLDACDLNWSTPQGPHVDAFEAEVDAHVRHLATQAREPAPNYEHAEVGYAYRMSNLPAAVGRGQLRYLDTKIARRREIRRRYMEQLGGLPGVALVPAGEGGGGNAWLTVISMDPEDVGTDRQSVRRHLGSRDIEARPVWTPLQLRLVYAYRRTLDGQVAGAAFTEKLCPPSGSASTDSDLDRISDPLGEVLE